MEPSGVCVSDCPVGAESVPSGSKFPSLRARRKAALRGGVAVFLAAVPVRQWFCAVGSVTHA